jgi:hypothetical protein
MTGVEFTDLINNRCEEIIEHHGIKGQKWGIRRFQNEDGSLTEAGKKHYSKTISDVKERKKTFKERKNLSTEELRSRLTRYQLEDQLYDEVLKAQKHYPFTYQQVQQIYDEMLKTTGKAEKTVKHGRSIYDIIKGKKKKNKDEDDEADLKEEIEELKRQLNS